MAQPLRWEKWELVFKLHADPENRDVDLETLEALKSLKDRV
jgi:hypothetical protein